MKRNTVEIVYNFILVVTNTDFTSGTLNSSAFASNTNANMSTSTTSFFDSKTSRTFFITGVKLEPVQVTDFEHEDVETALREVSKVLSSEFL